jgi:hypothetical protein
MIMILLACNAYEADKLLPLVIGKSENTHCFKWSESCPRGV